MKLKNKLLPLVGTAAIAATIAPISLTSCGASSSNGFVSLTKKYTPDLEYYKGADKFNNEFEAAEAYAKELQNNPEIFIGDYLWSSSKAIIDLINNHGTSTNPDSIYDGVPVKHDVRITDISSKMVVRPRAVSIYHIPLISLTIEYSYVYEFENSPKVGVLKDLIQREEKGTTEITNIPFIVYYDQFDVGYDSMWLWKVTPACVEGHDDFMRENQLTDYPWSIKTVGHSINTYTGYDPIKGAYTYTNEVDDSSLIKSTDVDFSEKTINMFVQEFSAYSYYFWLVGYEGNLPK